MLYKYAYLQLALLCGLSLLAIQANAGGGIFYSAEGNSVVIPSDAEAIILLKKGTEITAIDSHGTVISPCTTCETELSNAKMLVTLGKDGNLNIIGGTPAKSPASRDTAATQSTQDDLMQTVTEGIKLRQITKKAKAFHGVFLTKEGGVMVMNIDNGTVFDPVKMPRASDKINSGTVTTVNSIAKFATGGCPIEVKGNLPEGPYCYVINDVTGELLGDCPKEQYICKD